MQFFRIYPDPSKPATFSPKTSSQNTCRPVPGHDVRSLETADLPKVLGLFIHVSPEAGWETPALHPNQSQDPVEQAGGTGLALDLFPAVALLQQQQVTSFCFHLRKGRGRWGHCLPSGAFKGSNKVFSTDRSPPSEQTNAPVASRAMWCVGDDGGAEDRGMLWAGSELRNSLTRHPVIQEGGEVQALTCSCSSPSWLMQEGLHQYLGRQRLRLQPNGGRRSLLGPHKMQSPFCCRMGKKWRSTIPCWWLLNKCFPAPSDLCFRCSISCIFCHVLHNYGELHVLFTAAILNARARCLAAAGKG